MPLCCSLLLPLLLVVAAWRGKRYRHMLPRCSSQNLLLVLELLLAPRGKRREGRGGGNAMPIQECKRERWGRYTSSASSPSPIAAALGGRRSGELRAAEAALCCATFAL